MLKMFKNPNLTFKGAANLAKTKLKPPDEPQIEKEIDFEEKERKLIKSRTLKLTRRETIQKRAEYRRERKGRQIKKPMALYEFKKIRRKRQVFNQGLLEVGSANLQISQLGN